MSFRNEFGMVAISLLLAGGCSPSGPTDLDAVVENSTITNSQCYLNTPTYLYSADGDWIMKQCTDASPLEVDSVPVNKLVEYTVAATVASGDYHKCGTLILSAELWGLSSAGWSMIEHQSAASQWNSTTQRCTKPVLKIGVVNGGGGNVFYSSFQVHGHQDGVTASYTDITLSIHNPCASGSASDVFPQGIMFGCKGAVLFQNRAPLCGPNSHVCSSIEWDANRGSVMPFHNYWTNDNLGYGGSQFSCSASLTGASCTDSGGLLQPMRVCHGNSSGQDPEGNNCNWQGCGLNSTSNAYLGGCVGNTTAGTMCCSDK